MVAKDLLAGNLIRSSDVPRQVDSVLLFGSQARGDSDEASDLDVVTFVDATRAVDLEAARQQLFQLCDRDRLNLTIYGCVTAEQMAGLGSLFMWHLRLEGKVLFSRGPWLHHVMGALQPYSTAHARRDLDMLRQVFDESIRSLERGTPTAVFDAAAIYTVLRNIGIASAFIAGTPTFGRRAPIRWLAQRMGFAFPYSSTEVDFLEACRLAYSGRSTIQPPLQEYVLALGQRGKAVLDFAKDCI